MLPEWGNVYALRIGQRETGSPTRKSPHFKGDFACIVSAHTWINIYTFLHLMSIDWTNLPSLKGIRQESASVTRHSVLGGLWGQVFFAEANRASKDSNTASIEL